VSSVLLDTGPLVAYLHSGEQHHDWAVAQFGFLTEPVLTCEPVWTEAAYLLSRCGARSDVLWSVLRSGAVRFDFGLGSDYESVAALMRRYAEVSMSLADACLIRMSEQQRESKVFTLDSHFQFYRRFSRQVIPLICPF
jgi:predicted nucleic acid-binding protein